MADKFESALKLTQRSRAPTRKVYELLLSAEADGDPRAVYALATWHLFGNKFIKKDLRVAIQKLELAAASNVPEACYDLAVSYEKGISLARSPRKAFEFYVRAALFGDKQSVFEVGRMYHHGIGTRQNRRLAKIWFTKADALGIKR